MALELRVVTSTRRPDIAGLGIVAAAAVVGVAAAGVAAAAAAAGAGRLDCTAGSK